MGQPASARVADPHEGRQCSGSQPSTDAEASAGQWWVARGGVSLPCCAMRHVRDECATLGQATSFAAYAAPSSAQRTDDGLSAASRSCRLALTWPPDNPGNATRLRLPERRQSTARGPPHCCPQRVHCGRPLTANAPDRGNARAPWPRRFPPQAMPRQNVTAGFMPDAVVKTYRNSSWPLNMSLAA